MARKTWARSGTQPIQALRKFLLYGTKAKMENCAESWGLLLVSGPKSAEAVTAAFGSDVDILKPLHTSSPPPSAGQHRPDHPHRGNRRAGLSKCSFRRRHSGSLGAAHDRPALLWDQARWSAGA